MLYNPSAQQRAAVPVRPTSRTTAKKAAKPSPKFDDIDRAFMASGEELAKRQQQQQKKQAEDQPWWQDALGFTANVLSPLTVPGKLVTFGLEQATRHLPSPVRRFMQDPASYVTPDSWEKNKFIDAITEAGDAAVPLINPFMGQDIEKVDADKRSFFNKIAPRSTYGSEAIYQDIDVPGLTGLRNLALDIGHDPLTAIGGGERIFAKGAELGADAAKAASAAEKASKGFDTAVEAYAKALESGAHPMLQHGLAQNADTLAADLAKATGTANQAAERAANLRRAVHAPSTPAQRASFVASLAGKDPELVAKYQSELTKGINRGFGRMSAEARQAIDMAPRALRFGDTAIPGTGKLVEAAGLIGSGKNAAFSKIGEYLPETMRNMRVPDTVAEARKALRSKSTTPEMYQLNADFLRITNDIRLGAGEMKLRGAQAVNRDWRKTFSKMGTAERDAMRVAAEASPEANAVNDLMTKLAKVHEQITGRPFEDFSSINPNQYLPHIQSKEWAKWLKEHPDDPRAVAYKGATDFKTKDLLHTSGFVDRARKLRLAPGELSKEIPLGDRTLRINGNTIDHLNEGLSKAFPEFSGKFYETDLDKIFQTYSEALARDAGTRKGWKELAASASPYGRRVEGELADSLDKMNEALGQQSVPQRLRKMVDDRGGTFTPGERLEVPGRPLAPGTKRDREALEFWKGYGLDLSRAVKKGDMDQVYRLTENAEKHALPRTGVEVLGKPADVTPGFTRVRIDGKVTEVPDAALARGAAGDIPAEHLKILTPRVSDSATQEITNWAQSGAPTSFAGASNAEGTAVRKQILADMTDIQKNAYEGLRSEVNAGSARIKSLREVADEYVKKIKGLKVDRNNAAEVTAFKEAAEKNVVDLENEIRARNSVWKGKGTREANKIDKELNRQLRVLKDHVTKLETKLDELPAEIRREIKWRKEQLFKPVADAKAQVRDSLAHFRTTNPLPYTPEQITWALDTEAAARAASQAAPVTDDAQAAAIEALREEYRAAVSEAENLQRTLSDGKLTEESRAAIQARIAAQQETAEGIIRRTADVRNPEEAAARARHQIPAAENEVKAARIELEAARTPEWKPLPGEARPTAPVGPPLTPEGPLTRPRKRITFEEQRVIDEAWKEAGNKGLPPEDWRPPPVVEPPKRLEGEALADYRKGYRSGKTPSAKKIENADAAGRNSEWYQGFYDAERGDPLNPFESPDWKRPGAEPEAATEVVEEVVEAAPKPVKRAAKKAAEAPAEAAPAVARDTTEIEARLAAAEKKLDDLRAQADAAPGARAAEEAADPKVTRNLKRAREINSNMAAYEKRMQAAIAEPQNRLNQAIEQMRKQPEALVYNRDKSMRYFHDEAGRWASDQSARPDVFGSRRVEAVTQPPQRGAYNVDVPGVTSPEPMAPPDLHPTVDVRAVPKGMRGAEMRRGMRKYDPNALPPRPGAMMVPGGGADELGGIRVGTHGVQVPPQRLEADALKDLERIAQSPNDTAVGRYARNQREAANIAEQTLPTRIANEQAAAATANEVGRLTEQLPRMAQKATAESLAQPLGDLEPIVKELAQEVDTRGQLRVLRDQYKSLPLGTKKVDLDATIRDLSQFNANNDLLDPVTRAATDDQLKQFATESQRIAGNKDVVTGLGKMARDARSGKLKDEYLGGLAEGWSGIHSGPVQRGDFIMDDRLRGMLQRAEKTIDDPKLFGRIFNEATNVFKTYATLSPSFHVRNAISGIFMNAADGVSLVNQLDGWKYVRQFRTAPDGEAWLAKQSDEVKQAFEIMGGSGGGGRFAEAGFAGLNEKEALNKITRNRATLFSQRAGERVEQSLRLGMALDSVRIGHNAHEALERISKIHFDYSQLSKLDETMKRLIPFWTFMSRNLPLQLQMVYTMPAVYSGYEHFKRNASSPNAPFTPGYWATTGAFNTGASIGGMPMYLQPDMGIDQVGTQLAQLKEIGSGNFGAALSELNPIALAPLEYAFKKDLFRDRTFTDADYSKASGPIGNLAKALATIVPGATKNVGSETLVSDNFMNMLTSIIPPISQASRLAPQATGDLSDINRQAEAIARYIGVPLRTLSPKQQETEARNQYYDARDAASVRKKLAQRAAA